MSAGGRRTAITRSRQCSPSPRRGTRSRSRTSLACASPARSRRRWRAARTISCCARRAASRRRSAGAGSVASRSTNACRSRRGSAGDRRTRRRPCGCCAGATISIRPSPACSRSPQASAPTCPPALARARRGERAGASGWSRWTWPRASRCCWSTRACRSRPARCSPRGTAWIAGRWARARRSPLRWPVATIWSRPRSGCCP